MKLWIESPEAWFKLNETWNYTGHNCSHSLLINVKLYAGLSDECVVYSVRCKLPA